jgi:hypothetical protein
MPLDATLPASKRKSSNNTDTTLLHLINSLSVEGKRDLQAHALHTLRRAEAGGDERGVSRTFSGISSTSTSSSSCSGGSVSSMRGASSRSSNSSIEYSQLASMQKVHATNRIGSKVRRCQDQSATQTLL